MQLTIAIILLAGSALAAPKPLLPVIPSDTSEGSGVSAPTGLSGPPVAGAPPGEPPALGPPGGGSPVPCAPPPPGPLDPSQVGLSSTDSPQDDSSSAPDSSDSSSSLAARADMINDPRGLIGDIKHVGEKIGQGIKHAGEKVGSGVEHAGEKLVNGVKHAGEKVNSGIGKVSQKVNDALVIDGCHVVKCGIALGPTEASCVAAAVEDGLNAVADAGCFAGAANTIVNKPEACNGCPLSGLSAVKKIAG